MMEETNTNTSISNENTKKQEFEMWVSIKIEQEIYCMHSHCGMHDAVGDVLWLVHVVVTTNGLKEPEDAIKLVKIVDEYISCTFAFVS